MSTAGTEIAKGHGAALATYEPWTPEALKTCRGCGRTLPASSDYFYRSRIVRAGLKSQCKRCLNEARTSYRKTHAEQARASARRYFAVYRRERAAELRMYFNNRNARVRQEVLAHYGGRCACCGETEPSFLGIDHIHGGGRAHRRQVGVGTGLYHWLKRNGYPAGFRLLCHNCNMARGLYGRCPHEAPAEATA